MQHVNNVRMLEIVEEAHFEMFYRGESTETSDSIVPRFVIVRHEVNYRSALTFQKHPVMVDTEVVEFRAAQYKLISSVHDTQNTYCTVLTNAVAVSSETQRVRSSPKRRKISWPSTSLLRWMSTDDRNPAPTCSGRRRQAPRGGRSQRELPRSRVPMTRTRSARMRLRTSRLYPNTW